jgi:hypothetical protein
MKELIQVPARLWVVPEIALGGGAIRTEPRADLDRARLATPADLENLRYRHEDRMRERAMHLFELMGLDYESDDDRICVLRYFVEMVTVYDHDPDQDSLDNLHALITGEGTVLAT